MAIRKIRDHVLKPDKTTDIIHYESSADIIVVQPVQGKITATNVQKALEDLADVAATGGVTSVNGKTGAVILGATDVGAEPAFAKNTAFNKNFGTDAGTVMEGNDTRVTGAVADIQTIKGQIGEINTKNSEQDSAISTAQAKADEAYNIAQGRAKAVSFATYGDMVAALKAAGKTDYKVGDNLFIVATDVPDYWVSAVLDNNTGDTGYFSISPLESQKVDLSEYQKKTDNSLNTTNKTVVGAINEVKGTADGASTKANANEETLNKIVGGQQEVAKATNANTAVNVTGQINGKAIDSIFEADGITAKKATTAAGADQAAKLAAAKTISLTGAVNGSVSTDLSSDAAIATTLGEKVVGSTNIADGAVTAAKLATSGVTAGTYSAVQVTDKGIVTAGAQMFEFGTEVGVVSPSSTLAIGGFYLELLGTVEE